MAKSKKRKADTKAFVQPANKKQKSETITQVSAAENAEAEESELVAGLIYRDELQAATDTLAILSSHPEVLSSRELRPLRISLHDCLRSSQVSGSISARISSALVEGRYQDARVLLSEMRIRGQMPKLGSLQRWTRELDAVLRPGMSKEEEAEIWGALDAILRTTQPVLATRSEEVGIREEGSRVEWFKPFKIPEEHVPDVQDVQAIVAKAVSAFKVLEITPGEDRRPPNKYPATIFYSPANIFPLASERPICKRYDVPGVPGAFSISSVFSSGECDALVQTVEAVGLQPDEPVAGSAVQLSSVLAHNLIWLADEEFISTLFSRIKDLLPQHVGKGAVKGVNARFRFYRYRPGALYRPHIDGAWPASALNNSTTPPSYTYDSDPTLYSRLTLLIYLNDDFNGGCTTFFLPSPNTEGVVQARPLQPRKGSVAVFPHGSSESSLLHEGSGVENNGTKYVIRTEVLYEVDAKERGGTDALSAAAVPVLSGAS